MYSSSSHLKCPVISLSVFRGPKSACNVPLWTCRLSPSRASLTFLPHTTQTHSFNPWLLSFIIVTFKHYFIRVSYFTSKLLSSVHVDVYICMHRPLDLYSCFACFPRLTPLHVSESRSRSCLSWVLRVREESMWSVCMGRVTREVYAISTSL